MPGSASILARLEIDGYVSIPHVLLFSEWWLPQKRCGIAMDMFEHGGSYEPAPSTVRVAPEFTPEFHTLIHDCCDLGIENAKIAWLNVLFVCEKKYIRVYDLHSAWYEL